MERIFHCRKHLGTRMKSLQCENIPPSPLSPSLEDNRLSLAATVFLNEHFPLGHNFPNGHEINPDNLISQFDHHFPTHQHYRNFVDQCLKDWTRDPDFRAFDMAYCHHHLSHAHIVRYQQMIASLTDMLWELNKTDTVQINNIKSLIPRLATNGMIAQISQTLFNATSPNSWTTAPIT